MGISGANLSWLFLVGVLSGRQRYVPPCVDSHLDFDATFSHRRRQLFSRLGVKSTTVLLLPFLRISLYGRPLGGCQPLLWLHHPTDSMVPPEGGSKHSPSHNPSPTSHPLDCGFILPVPPLAGKFSPSDDPAGSIPPPSLNDPIGPVGEGYGASGRRVKCGRIALERHRPAA